jgi:hypothetical protein
VEREDSVALESEWSKKRKRRMKKRQSFVDAVAAGPVLDEDTVGTAVDIVAVELGE